MADNEIPVPQGAQFAPITAPQPTAAPAQQEIPVPQGAQFAPINADTAAAPAPDTSTPPSTALDVLVNPQKYDQNLPQFLHNVPGLDAARGMGTGATKGVLETLHGIGHYGTSALHAMGFDGPEVPIQSPEYLQAHGLSETVGKVGEGVAEFFLGDEALKGLSIADRLMEASKVSKMLERYPRLAAAVQVGIGAMRAGAVQTTQSLAHGATPGEALQTGAETGLTAGVLGAGSAVSQVAESPIVRALGKGTELAGGATFAGKGLHDLVTPKQEGETDQQTLDRQVSGAVQGLMGAHGLIDAAPGTGQTLKAGGKAAVNAVKNAAGVPTDFLDAVYKISKPSKGYAKEYLDTLKKADPQLRQVMQDKPDVGTPEDIFKAIDNHIKQNDATIAAEAEKFRGKPEAQMTGIENQVRSELDKAFKENPGQYTPEEQSKAVSSVMKQLLQEEPGQLEGTTQLREPELREVEGVRQRFNQDTKPVMGQPGVPPAEAFAKQTAARVLRSAIDQKFSDLGLNNVKEWRGQEAALIDVRDQLGKAVQKSKDMGDYSILQSAIKQFGWRIPMAAMAGMFGGGVEGGIFAGLGGAGLGMIADLSRDIRTNPNRMTEKAAKMANEGGPSGAKLPEKAGGAGNPSAATAASGLGSTLDLEARREGETETQYQTRLESQPAKPIVQYNLPTEPIQKTPVSNLPSGFVPGDEHVHEWGHVTNAALEGWGTEGIKSHLNPTNRTLTTSAAATVIPRGIDWKDPGSIARNSGRIGAVIMGGAVANELHSSIPFEINKGIGSDMRVLKGAMKEIGITDDEFDDFVRYARDRARRNLTQPGISDILLQNAKAREADLSPTMHASPDRTEGYAQEVRRIQDENRAKTSQSGQPGGVQGNGERSNGEVRPVDQGVKPGGPKEVPAGPAAGDLEASGLKERTTGDQQVDDHIRAAGGVPAGSMENLALFHDPQTGSTLALDKRDVTPELVQKHLDESRAKFGVKKADLETAKEEEHPTITALKTKYGSSTNAADMTKGGASFLHPDGTVTNIGALDHPAAIASAEGRGPKGGASVDRTEFINETGSIRVRHRPSGKAGPEIVFSVPEKGVTPDQVDMMRQAVGKMGRNSNLLIEAAREGEQPSESVRSWPENKVKEFARPSDVEPMLREIGAHPDQKLDLETRQDWAKKAEEDAEKQGGGFTIDPRTGESPERGYMVEAAPEKRVMLDHPAKAADIEKFYQDNKQLFDEHPELHVGGYGKELNISANVENRQAAENLAKKLDQISIWDVRKGEEIPTGGKSETTSFPDYPLNDRMSDLRGKLDLETSKEPEFTHKTFGLDDSIGRVDATDAGGESIGHVTYNLPSPTKRTGDFNATIAMASVDEPGKGLGQKLYLETAQQVKNKGARYLVSDTAHGVDPSAIRVWDKLIEKGYPVEKLGEKKYRMDLSELPAAKDEGDTSFNFGANVKPVESKPYDPENSKRVSPVFPTAVNRTVDPMNHENLMSHEAIHESPAVAQRLADKIVKQNKSMVFSPEELKTPKGIFDSFIRQAKDNIKAIYNQAPEEDQTENRVWYDGANKFTREDAEKHGVSHEQAGAVLANLSPQKDWDINVSLYNRLMDVYFNKSDLKTTPEMMQKGKEFVRNIAKANAKKIATGKQPSDPWVARKLLNKIEGKTFSQLTNPVDKAAWLRLYDEAHNSREFNELNADGTVVGVRKTLGGQPEKVAWGGLDTISKGIKILQDGSLENISRNLGDAHKVRSFYNNIMEPNAPHGDVTSDTHHVGLALGRPVAGSDPEPAANFSGNGSSVTGVHGTYPLYVEATRQAMKELNAEHPDQEPIRFPRQLQSVVWVEWRKMFPPEVRTPAVKAGVNNIWKEHLDGQITADEARDKIRQYARQLRSGVDEGERSPSDQGELYGDQLHGAGPTGPGLGGEPPAGNPVPKRVTPAMKIADRIRELTGTRAGEASLGGQ